MSVDKKINLTGELTEDCTHLRLDHSSALWRILQSLKGQKLEIMFWVFRYKRSDAQNRYIHGVIVPTVRAWYKETNGEVKSHDEVYTWLRIGLLGQAPVIGEFMGVEIITMSGKRFSKMTTKEFAEATDTILKLMAEKGCIIQEPKQNNFLSDFVQDQ